VSAANANGSSGNSNQASATPSAGGGAAQLLLNPGFESGTTPWVATSGVIGSFSSQPARTGTRNAWLCGYGSTHTDTLYQQVAIPASVTSATLTFWMKITTAETTTSIAYDTCQIQIRNTSNSILSTLATYSNLNKGTSYVQRSFNVTAWKGQTIRVYLHATEDSSLQSSFVCDDFALNTN
jgi:hypothetical protein